MYNSKSIFGEECGRGGLSAEQLQLVAEKSIALRLARFDEVLIDAPGFTGQKVPIRMIKPEFDSIPEIQLHATSYVFDGLEFTSDPPCHWLSSTCK